MRDHPIPPVTEPFQYRAIGIVRGIYQPDEDERFTRGCIIDSEGEKIESVVLGRVITLMQRHLILDKAHLWVVYPRCREVGQLHLQISGIWEPSTLTKENTNPLDPSKKSLKSTQQKKDNLPEGDDYFSIRGELIYTKPEENDFVIKIRQKPRTNSHKTLPFKLRLKGKLPFEYIRNFVNLKVRRIGQILILDDYEVIGTLPPKEGKKRLVKLPSDNLKKKNT